MAESNTSGYWSQTSEDILQHEFPLHRCCRDGDVETLSSLLDHPTDTYRRDACRGVYDEDTFYGWTPAHWAAYFGKLACLRKLMTITPLGVDCNLHTSRFRQTPAHVAAYGGHPSLLQWLLQSGAQINPKDYLGETPLHKASRTGSMECVSLLVAHGADLSIQNNNFHTASQLAKVCGYDECARYLNEAAENHQMMANSGISEQNGMNGAGDHDWTSANIITAAETDDSRMDVMDDTSPECQAVPSPDDANSRTPQRNGMTVAPPMMNVCGDTGDVLLHRGVSSNRVPIAGKKRARDEHEHEDVKRIRTGGGIACSACRAFTTNAASFSHPSHTTGNFGSSSRVENMTWDTPDEFVPVVPRAMPMPSPTASVLRLSTEPLKLNVESQHCYIRRSATRKQCVFVV